MSCVSVILLLSTGHVKNTFLLLPLVRNKHTQSHLCNQDCEMRAGSTPAGSFSSWWFKTFIILYRMWMLIFLSTSGNKGGSHPARMRENLGINRSCPKNVSVDCKGSPGLVTDVSEMNSTPYAEMGLLHAYSYHLWISEFPWKLEESFGIRH